MIDQLSHEEVSLPAKRKTRRIECSYDLHTLFLDDRNGLFGRAFECDIWLKKLKVGLLIFLIASFSVNLEEEKNNFEMPLPTNPSHAYILPELLKYATYIRWR